MGNSKLIKILVGIIVVLVIAVAGVSIFSAVQKSRADKAAKEAEKNITVGNLDEVDNSYTDEPIEEQHEVVLPEIEDDLPTVDAKTDYNVLDYIGTEIDGYTLLSFLNDIDNSAAYLVSSFQICNHSAFDTVAPGDNILFAVAENENGGVNGISLKSNNEDGAYYTLIFLNFGRVIEGAGFNSLVWNEKEGVYYTKGTLRTADIGKKVYDEKTDTYYKEVYSKAVINWDNRNCFSYDDKFFVRGIYNSDTGENLGYLFEPANYTYNW